MKRIKKDEVYVVNQPKHSIMSFVFVDPTRRGKNLNSFMSNSHDTTLELAEETDVMFIFKNIEGIDPDVFSKLYGASSWIITKGNLARTYIKALSYAIIIFKDPVGFLTWDTADFEYRLIDMELIRAVAGSSLSWPIFKAKHLDSDEMYNIYAKDNTLRPWWTWGQKINKPDREYTTWKMTSNVAFFRPSLFSKLSTLSEEYIDSFTWDHIRYFLGSACEYLGVKRLGYSLNELNINKIADYVGAERKE